MSGAATESRQERKERTRQAILDAALELSAESGMGAVSLRRITKQVGIVPTAFYRHFESVEDVGLVLVADAFVSLREMLRDVRNETDDLDRIVPTSLAVLARHVRERPLQFSFIARERSGSGPVHDSIAHQLELVKRELATDLARLPGPAAWSHEDLQAFSSMIVDQMVLVAERLLRQPRSEEEIVRAARTQILMMIVGAAHWHS